jgi:hypothetical protein
MAIYSCNLTSIGRTTHTAGTAGAHVRYITRPQAHPTIIAAHMPADPIQARNWIDRAERASRKNARVLDKIRIALPRELAEAQRAALVREFMNDLCGGKRVPWIAAIHQSGKDAHNPHVHIDVHDRSLDTGRRVLRLSDSTRDRLKAGLPGPKAVDWIRTRWEAVCNRALKRAGHDMRIDRRTLQAQGIDRAPTIHEGPRAQHINNSVKRPRSKSRTNGAGRVINYPFIDRGKTRREFNAHIIDLNLERAARSGNPETAVWAQFERDQAALDRALEKQLASERRDRTREERSTSATYLAQSRRVRAEHRLKSRQALGAIQAKFARQRDALRARQRQQRQELRKQQKGLMARIARRLSRNVRGRHIAARKSQIKTHREERHALSAAYQQAIARARDGLAVRYDTQLANIEAKRTSHLTELQELHQQAENFTDILRQQREAAREHQRQLTERKIQEWRKTAEQDRMQGAPRAREEFKQAAGGRNAKDDPIGRAVAKAKKKQEEERQSREDHDRGRSR